MVIGCINRLVTLPGVSSKKILPIHRNNKVTVRWDFTVISIFQCVFLCNVVHDMQSLLFPSYF